MLFIIPQTCPSIMYVHQRGSSSHQVGRGGQEEDLPSALHHQQWRDAGGFGKAEYRKSIWDPTVDTVASSPSTNFDESTTHHIQCQRFRRKRWVEDGCDDDARLKEFSINRQTETHHPRHHDASWNIRQGACAWRIRTNRTEHFINHRHGDWHCGPWRDEHRPRLS